MRDIAGVILVTQGNPRLGKAKGGQAGRQEAGGRQAGRQAGKAHFLSSFPPKASEPPSDHPPQTTFPIIFRIGVQVYLPMKPTGAATPFLAWVLMLFTKRRWIWGF